MNKLYGPRPILAGLTVFAVCGAAYLVLGVNPAESEVRGNPVAAARKPRSTSTVQEKPSRTKRPRTEIASGKQPRETRERVKGTDSKRRPRRPKPDRTFKKKTPPPPA